MTERHEFQREGTIIGDATINPRRDVSRRATPKFQTQAQLDPMLPILRDQINETHLIVPITAVSSLLLPASKYRRTYLLVQNLDTLSLCWLGFGFTPAANIGIQLAVNGGAYEPFKVPQGDIFIIGQGAMNVSVLYGAIG